MVTMAETLGRRGPRTTWTPRLSQPDGSEYQGVIGMPLKNLSLVAATVTLSVVTAAQATTVRQISFDQLCARAEVVISGTVTAVEARRDQGSDTIHTYTTFSRVEWIIGGDAGDTYVLRQLGGCVGQDCLQAHGMPRFEIGRRYVVFIRGNHRVACPVLGWWQGGFEVVRENEASPPTIRTYRGKRVLGITDGDIVVQPARATRAPTADLTLDEFVNRIRATRARPTAPPTTDHDR